MGSDLSDPEVRLTNALGKLADSEVRCATVNAAFENGDASAYLSVETHNLLRRARKIIARILGPFDWEAFPTMVEFSTGATTGLRRRQASIPDKWDFGTHCTAAALPYAVAFWRWLFPFGAPDRSFEIVAGNKVSCK